MKRLAIAIFVTVLLVAPAPAARGESSAEGPHFRVVIHFGSNGLEKEALRQVEALWGLAAEFYGLPKGRLRKRLEVHLYRNAADYEAAEARLIGGALKRNLAFAHYDTKTAHVALQPPLTDDVLKVVGLPFLTKSLLLHEAAHLVRFHAMSNYRNHPDWFEDGAAMWLKNRVLTETGAGAGEDLEPTSATSVVRVRKLLDGGTLPPAAAILADELDALEFYSRYATRWMFFRFLQAECPAELRAVVKAMRRLPSSPKLGAKLTARLKRALGEKRFAGLDEGFRKYIRSLEPEWDETLRSLSGKAALRFCAAFPDSNALAWRTAPVGRLTYVLAGTVEILPNRKRQLNVLLDRSGNDFVCVSLNADFGITIFEYESAGSQWHRRAARKHDAIVVGKPFRVRVSVTKGRVGVAIDGKEVLHADLPDRKLSGPWGLGALAGSAGFWREFGLVTK